MATVKGTGTFAMPVVLQNLPPSETLNQVIDNLNYLCGVFDTAFDTINYQIEQERNNIKSIMDRVDKASKKTELIKKYPNKSTTVYSHCTFPKDELPENNQIISFIEPTKTIVRPKYKLPVNERLKRPPNCDTLQLFHSVHNKTTKKIDDKVVGLGRLPAWIDSIGDCLLFNTDENLYLKYETKDNLEGVEGVDKDAEHYKMHAAPTTITDKFNRMDRETYDIAYRPGLENVPVFNVPTTLSGFGGMDGLAMDEQWDGWAKQQQKIAPSGANFEQLPELEALPDFEDDFGFGDAPAAPPKAPTPPPQQPPPPSQTAGNNNTQTPGGDDNKKASKPAPPKATAKAPGPKKKSGGGRMALLDSIKAGKSLSKASARKERKQKKAPKQPMSLMDHLKNKLKARNNVMRGKVEPTMKKKAAADPMSPPIFEDEPMMDEPAPASFLKKVAEPIRKKSADMNKKTDKTGLGLSNIPASMAASMLLLDDDGGMSSGPDGSWGSD